MGETNSGRLSGPQHIPRTGAGGQNAAKIAAPSCCLSFLLETLSCTLGHLEQLNTPVQKFNQVGMRKRVAMSDRLMPLLVQPSPDAFTHRSFYAQKFLHTHIQGLLHREVFTQSGS